MRQLEIKRENGFATGRMQQKRKFHIKILSALTRVNIHFRTTAEHDYSQHT